MGLMGGRAAPGRSRGSPSGVTCLRIRRRRPAARPCARASRPGTRRAPRASRRRRGTGGRARAARPPPRRSRFASTEPSAVTFIGPKPGSAPRRCFRSSASFASLQIRDASPPYSSATTAASSRTRSAIAPGKRWIAGFSRNASSRSSFASFFGSSVPTRCLSTSGPANAFCTGTCWSIAKPTSERERVLRDQLAAPRDRP